MYNTLRAEMARKGITSSNIATVLKKTKSTISLKINGKNDFTLREAVKIRDFLGVDMSIDELFKEE